MIIFQNPGLIDMMAVKTLGVNVKVKDTAFGFFGTGLKFAIATILRNGGKITIWRGPKAHLVRTRVRTIRDEPFKVVTLDGKELGFTDELGKNWEPWMVLRELGCNAKDEDGYFFKAADGSNIGEHLLDDRTTIVVEWDELDKAYDQQGSIFIQGQPAAVQGDIEVRTGPSQYIYYRGIRAYKLEHKSALTYNITSEQRLTEDRTLMSVWNANYSIARTLLLLDDKELLSAALLSGDSSYESRLELGNSAKYHTAGKAFLDVVLKARAEGDKGLIRPARDVLSSEMRKGQKLGYSGYSKDRYGDDELSRAQRALDYIFGGPEGHDPLEMEKTPVVVTSELAPGVLSLCENGAVYLSSDLVNMDRRDIAEHLMRRLIDNKVGPGEGDSETVSLMVPALLNSHSATRPASEREGGDAPLSVDEGGEGSTYSVVDGLLMGMGVPGEQTPIPYEVDNGVVRPV